MTTLSEGQQTPDIKWNVNIPPNTLYRFVILQVRTNLGICKFL